MRLADAQREYQAAMEYRRTAFSRLEGLESFEEERSEINAAVWKAEDVLMMAWLEEGARAV